MTTKNRIKAIINLNKQLHILQRMENLTDTQARVLKQLPEIIQKQKQQQLPEIIQKQKQLPEITLKQKQLPEITLKKQKQKQQKKQKQKKQKSKVKIRSSHTNYNIFDYNSILKVKK